MTEIRGKGAALVIVLSAFVTLHAQAPTPADWTALTARLEKAALEEDPAEIRLCRAGALRFVATPSPAVPLPLARYAVAYADFRVAFSPALGEKEQKDLAAEAVKQLTRAIKEDPKFAEARALLANMYGVQIAQAPELGMTLGMESGMEMSRATALDPQNPRVLVLDAISKFNTPPEYGGSVAEAESTLRRAIAILEKEPRDKPWPNWGRVDAHVWLGQALAKQGNIAGARAEYQAALTLAPHSKWITTVLLPQLGK